MTAVNGRKKKKIVCYSFQRRRNAISCRGHMGKHEGLHEAEGEGRTVDKNLYCDFLRKEWLVAWETVAWIVSVHSGAQGLTLVVWYLSLGWLGQVDTGQECENLIKVVGVWALYWFVCIWKVHSQESYLLSLGIGSTREGQFLRGHQGTKKSKLQNMDNKDMVKH